MSLFVDYLKCKPCHQMALNAGLSVAIDQAEILHRPVTVSINLTVDPSKNGEFNYINLAIEHSLTATGEKL